MIRDYIALPSLVKVANMVVFWANTAYFGLRKCFLANTNVIGVNIVEFGENTVVFGTNTVVFASKYSIILGKFKDIRCK